MHVFKVVEEVAKRDVKGVQVVVLGAAKVVVPVDAPLVVVVLAKEEVRVHVGVDAITAV